MKIGRQRTKEFPVRIGVLEGDTLAPLIFVIVLDFAINRINANVNFGIVTHEDSNIPRLADLDFADDITLFDSSTRIAIHHIDTLEEDASKIGLNINYTKTKAKVISISKVDDRLEARNNEIELVDDFNYLALTILSSNTDFLQRRPIAWSNFCRRLANV